ncbi:DUF1501 domain-containing protein [Comamonas testosteroni]|uniref:DUF1501 domain-containing protein n=1 Tax=Comamonas testosteroni (strain DSM 14576 / KF-1) TaxID=399795 RepID=B7X374_COMTK|nr:MULTISPECIES: DUF1501 domain-containing protein [Comamonas]EED70303.1 protein of unknown function DUF1501 [Comamonas testosteroni KF-1]TYK71282.1 DUF1501 domain-containing protein [Comamonas sp. Z3]WQG68228.1 DUF1501 domain-containing protein [Comamonas testosteroni]
MHRRQFLSLGAALPLVCHLGQGLATPLQSSSPRFLLIFLRGAYDCNSLLVPTHSDFYYQARPSIAIARPGSADGALALNPQWGLHPALQSTLLPLYEQGQACFVPFAGSNDLSRSHFETQDSIELGQPQEGGKSFQSGFLNRLTRVLQADSQSRTSLSPMAFTAQLPLCLRGSAQVANMALASVRKTAVDEQRSQIIASMYQGSALEVPVREGFAVQRAVQRSVQEEMDQAGRNAISAKGFSLVAQRMAHLMREQFDLGFVDIGGWDTHVNQGAASGNLANRLSDLSQGLATFAGSMGAEAWRHTVVAVISEFGRTFRENGNKGTDHGHGTAYWFLGGGLSAQAGGKVLGEQIEVTEKALFQNRDYPVLNEYRSLLGGLFARMYGLNASQLQQIFPASQPGRLQLV